MTTETDLLPLVGTLWALPEHVQGVVQAYARACVAHATAPLQAENERLRAEVERLTFEMGCLQQQYDERTAYMIVHRGAWLACSDAVRSAYSEEHHRAERLAEALRLIESAKDRGFGIDYARGVAQSALLRDQEEGK